MNIDKQKWFYGIVALSALCFVLAALFIPTVGTCGHGHLHGAYGASRSQLSNYLTALQMFRSEYRDFPSIFDDKGQLNLMVQPDSERFIEALSGRKPDGSVSKAHGNHRGIAFYSFSEAELTTSKELGYRQITDRMGNTNIVVCVDHDGDGMIEVMDEGELKQLRTSVTIYTIPKEGERSIRLWD